MTLTRKDTLHSAYFTKHQVTKQGLYTALTIVLKCTTHNDLYKKRKSSENSWRIMRKRAYVCINVND